VGDARASHNTADKPEEHGAEEKAFCHRHPHLH
jgi:hypothetical protein